MSRIRDLAKPHIRELDPYPPGKPIEELERELGVQDSVKLASNESAFGPSPGVASAPPVISAGYWAQRTSTASKTWSGTASGRPTNGPAPAPDKSHS